MKKFCVIICLICLFFFSLTDVYGKTVLQKKVKYKRTVASKLVSEREEPYKAFLVVEASTAKVLEGQNANEKRAPASVTKLMVAFIVLERLSKGDIRLDTKITVSKEASKIGGSQVYLKEGEVFTLEELMKATLVASANDAAYAIAEHIAGSKEEFVRLMNEKAKSLGMVNTEFNSVHGLPPNAGQKEDMTTCNDLAILARELLKYPKIIEWTSIKSEGFRDGRFIMNNHNKLLTKMDGIVDGMKTGYYSKTGFNIVATGKKSDLRFIVIVMGSPSAKTRDSFAIEKFKKAFSQYRIINVIKKGEVIDKDIYLEDGKYRKIKGISNGDFTYPIHVENKGAIKKEIVVPERVKGEIKVGQKLGEILIKLDTEVIGKVDIVSPVFVPKANLFTRFIRKLGLNI